MLDDRDTCRVHVLDARHDGFRLGRDRDGRQFVDFRLDEADTALVNEGIFDGAEADRDGADEPDLDGLPRFVDPVLERSGLFDRRYLGFEVDAVRRGLVELHRADRLHVVVLPEQRHGVLERDSERFDDVADAVDGRRGRNASNYALVLAHRLDRQRRVGAARHCHDDLLRFRFSGQVQAGRKTRTFFFGGGSPSSLSAAPVAIAIVTRPSMRPSASRVMPSAWLSPRRPTSRSPLSLKPSTDRAIPTSSTSPRRRCLP